MKEEITGLIVTGGPIDHGFAREFIKGRTFDKIIAVDRGLNAVLHLELIPDAIVGDFDSADEQVLNEFKSRSLPADNPYSTPPWLYQAYSPWGNWRPLRSLPGEPSFALFRFRKRDRCSYRRRKELDHCHGAWPHV